MVLPDDSPRAYDDLGVAARRGAGRERRAHRLARQARPRSRCAARTPIRCASTSTACRSTSPPGGGVDISTLPIGDVERVEVYRGTLAARVRRVGAGRHRRRSRRARRASPRAGARTGAGSFGTMFGDVSGGGRVGRLRLYVGVHGFSAHGDFPYLNDNGTALNPADDVDDAAPEQRRAAGRRRAARRADAGGPPHAGPRRASAFARDAGAAGHRRLPDDAARAFGRCAASATCATSRATISAPAGACRRSCSRPGSAIASTTRAARLGLGGASLTHDTTHGRRARTPHAARPFGDWARGAAVLEGRHESYQPVNELADRPGRRAGAAARRASRAAEIDLRWRWADLDVIPSARLEAMQDVVSRRDAAGDPARRTPAVSRRSPMLRAAAGPPAGRAADAEGRR